MLFVYFLTEKVEKTYIYPKKKKNTHAVNTYLPTFAAKETKQHETPLSS